MRLLMWLAQVQVLRRWWSVVQAVAERRQRGGKALEPLQQQDGRVDRDEQGTVS